MRKGARWAVIVVGGIALASVLALAAWATGGLAAPVDETPAAAVHGGLSHREALVGLLTLGILALALFGFDLRDWF